MNENANENSKKLPSEISIHDDKDYMKSANIVGNDDISALLIRFSTDDRLYAKLEEAGLDHLIITEKMRDSLTIGRQYRPIEVAEMVNMNDGTLRGWLIGKESPLLPYYINADRDGKFHILDAEAVFRVRLINLVQQEMKYSLNHIASMATGMTAPKGKPVLPAEELDNIKERLQAVETRNTQLEKQNKILYAMISSFMEEDPFTNEYKFKVSSIPLLEEKTQQLEAIQEQISHITDNMKDVQTQVNEKLEQIDQKTKEQEEYRQQLTQKSNEGIETVRNNMLLTKAEFLASQERSLIQKLLNKRPDDETIEKFYKKLKEETSNK